jgi:heme oxygenase
MLALRNETADHHRRAEQHEFQQQMVRGTLPEPLYIRWLGQMLLVHSALEAHLDRLVTRDPVLGAVFDASRHKAPALRADLRHFKTGEDTTPLPAAKRLIELFDRLSRERPRALLGALYVLEGSTNGSKFIARRVRPAYGLPATGPGSAYLDPYGDLQPVRWQEFKAAMDALDLPADDVAQMTIAAQQTFDAIRELGADLLSVPATAAQPG